MIVIMTISHYNSVTSEDYTLKRRAGPRATCVAWERYRWVRALAASRANGRTWHVRLIDARRRFPDQLNF